jgi:hypothetical protein
MKVENIRSKANAIPVQGKNCSPSHRNGVRFQTGIAFVFHRIPHFERAKSENWSAMADDFRTFLQQTWLRSRVDGLGARHQDRVAACRNPVQTIWWKS